MSTAPRTKCLAIVLVTALWIAPGPSAAEGASWKPPSTKGWVEARSAHFTVYSNAGEGRATKIAVHLERFRKALGRISKGLVLDDAAPSSFFAFRNEPDFAPYRRGNVAGYFFATPFRNYMALDAASGWAPMRVVYHEYFHQIVRATLGDVPLWLNEGLAEFFSTFHTEDRGSVVQVGHPIEEHVAFLSSRGMIPWDDVFRTKRDSPTYHEGDRQGSFYAQSWLLTHYLTATDARLKSLGRFLQLLRDGSDPDRALETAFGMTRPEIAVAANAYGRKIGNYIWIDLGEENAKTEVAVRELAPAEVMFRLGDLLAQQGQTEPARNHLERARSDGWPAAEVEAALGAAAFRARDWERAETHLRKATEAGAPFAAPHVLLGELLLQRAGKRKVVPGGAVPPEVAQARAAFQKGIDAEPKSVPALLGFAGTFRYESGTERGIEAIVKARELRPFDEEVLQLGACLLARGGKPAAAGQLVAQSLAPRNAKSAAEAMQCVADGASSAAFDRLLASDATEARRIIAEAMTVVTDPEERAELASLDRTAASGAKIVVTEAPPDARLDGYVAAVELANSAKYAEAIARLAPLLADCPEGKTCEAARKLDADLRRHVSRNEWIASYNRAVALADDFKRKEAVAILRSLERDADDPEIRSMVLDLLRKLGQKPAAGTKP